jgi:ribonuclease D
MLEDGAVEVVFHDADYDLRLLHQDYGWHVRNIFDTRIAAQLLGIRSFGLAALLEDFFGVRLDKKHQRADWSLRPLTQGMLDYAAQDTRYLLDLRDELRSRLEKLGRLEWAKEEFERLEGTRWEPEDDSQNFLKIKGARDLTRRELALLRELVPWRDGVARELDRATFRVMGNEVLLDIARKAPTDAKQLAGLKGMPRGILDRGGAAILSAVKRGLEVAEEHLPKFPRAAKWEREEDFEAKVTKLKTIRDGAATRLLLDPGVLCSRERLEAIVRAKPRRVKDLEDVPGLRRWQIGEMGEEFVEALRA